MKLINMVLVIILAICLYAQSLIAQETVSLTIEEAINMGLTNNKMLKGLYFKTIASEAKYQEAKTYALPSLKLQASYTRLSEVDPFNIKTPFGNFLLSPSIPNSYTTKLTIQQPLYTGGKISSSIDAAKFLDMASEEEYIKDVQETRFSIQTAYWNLFRARLMKQVLNETYNNISIRVNDASNLYKQGLLTKNDLLKIQVQQADIKFRLLETVNTVSLANKSFNNLVGLPLFTEVTPTSEILTAENTSWELTQLMTDALQNRPEIKSTKFKISATKQAVTQAQSGWFPQVLFMGNYTYANPNQRIFPAEEKFIGTWDVSLVLSYDLWNWMMPSYQSQQAEANLRQIEESFETMKDGIALEVSQNYLTLQQTVEKFETAKLGLEQAEENIMLTSSKFKEGMALSSEVIDAETALFQAKANYTSSLIDFELAKVRLLKSAGK